MFFLPAKINVAKFLTVKAEGNAARSVQCTKFLMYSCATIRSHLPLKRSLQKSLEGKLRQKFETLNAVNVTFMSTGTPGGTRSCDNIFVNLG